MMGVQVIMYLMLKDNFYIGPRSKKVKDRPTKKGVAHASWLKQNTLLDENNLPGLVQD